VWFTLLRSHLLPPLTFCGGELLISYLPFAMGRSVPCRVLFLGTLQGARALPRCAVVSPPCLRARALCHAGGIFLVGPCPAPRFCFGGEAGGHHHPPRSRADAPSLTAFFRVLLLRLEPEHFFRRFPLFGLPFFFSYSAFGSFSGICSPPFDRWRGDWGLACPHFLSGRFELPLAFFFPPSSPGWTGLHFVPLPFS